MRSRLDSLWLGIILGIGLPFIVLVMFYYTSFTGVPFAFFWEHTLHKGMLPKLISLFAIPNLGVFFLFMSRNHYFSARGVIIATFLLTFMVLIMKIFF